MASNTDRSPDSSRDVSRAESLIEHGSTNTSSATGSIPAEDERKQPWRSVPELQNVKEHVSVKDQQDMRLFGNQVNAHS
ncbi:MAG: hypothetical protein L6R38_004851 [Xanthoria sp. 2 TBL-2021]|nr:MAG: hypothetical protein L6R38_004851 [Xanthoria sp. 2 TBL-2021]